MSSTHAGIAPQQRRIGQSGRYRAGRGEREFDADTPADVRRPGPQGTAQALLRQGRSVRQRAGVRDNFWNSICSLIWLPLAFFSGIRMKEMDPQTFVAARCCRSAASTATGTARWPAGPAGQQRDRRRHVRLRHLRRRLHRRLQASELHVPAPCFGPAVYRMTPRENIKPLIARRRVQHHDRHGHPASRPPAGREGQARRPVRRDVPRDAEDASQHQGRAGNRAASNHRH